MTVRDERAAVLRRWNRDLGDNFTAVLPRLLDDLEAIDAAHGGQLAAGAADAALAHERELMARGDLSAGPAIPPDAWLTAWIRAHDREFGIWVAKQARINGGGDPRRVLGPPIELEAKTTPPAKPATARTTTRRRTRT